MEILALQIMARKELQFKFNETGRLDVADEVQRKFSEFPLARGSLASGLLRLSFDWPTHKRKEICFTQSPSI